NRSDFAANVSTAKGVEAAVATAKFATSLGEDKLGGTDATDAAVAPGTPVTDADTFSPLQWDMRQINVPEAHAITGGSPSDVVGDIDTGHALTTSTSPTTATSPTRGISTARTMPSSGPSGWPSRGLLTSRSRTACSWSRPWATSTTTWHIRPRT